MATDSYGIFSHQIYSGVVESGKYVFGSKLLERDSASIVTRNDDAQWHDFVHGTFEGLLRGFTNGVASHNTSLCPMSDSNFSFLNAPLCMGNIGELVDKHFSGFLQHMDQESLPNVNGSVYALSFGSLDCLTCTDALAKGTLKTIRQRSKLNCGVIDDPKIKGLSLMSELYCRAVAVALFQGDASAVNITHFDSFNDTFKELSEGGLDMVAGESRYGLLGWWSPDLSGWSADLSGHFRFSIPYYYTSLDK
jgi:hypothetical protein